MTSPAVPVHPSVSRTPLPLDARDLPNVCVLCSHNCGIRVDVEGGRITRVRADETNPITHGYICNKGFAIGHYVEHAQRVREPLRRRTDGRFEPVSWDEAIASISTRLGQIVDESGPRAVGLVGIGGQANHMDAAFGLTWLSALGSKRWFNALAQEKTQHFLLDQKMFDATPSVFFHPDIEHTRFLLLLGTNPRISNRAHNPNDTFRRVVENPEQKLVVVDPRETETTRGADVHLRIRPGTDAHLLLGMVASLVQGEGLLDPDFVRQHTAGFEELRAALESVDVAEMARRCGLSQAEVVGTAREFATAPSAAVMYDLAVEQTPFSTLVSYLIRVLSVVTGNAGRPGGNLFFETATPPARSPKRFEEPERALASGIQSVPAMGGYAMFSPTLVPEEVLLDHPERLRALVVEGANPLLSYSDSGRWREACARLDLLVVIEPAFTETAQLADWVLPTPVGYEKWETAGFPKGFPQVFVQLRPPVVPGPEQALPEPEIYARLAEAMGVPEPPAELFELARTALEPDGAARFFNRLSEASGGNAARMLFWAYRTLGPELPSPALVSTWVMALTNAFARRESALRALGEDWKDAGPFELGLELFRRILDHPEGVEIARAAPAERNLEENLGFEDGRIRLAPEGLLEELARAVATPPRRDPDYPFLLASGLRTRWTANTIQRDPAWRKGRGPHCTLHLCPEDASRLGVKDGDRLRISTRRGSAELPAELDKHLQAGHVWIPNGFGAAYPRDGSGELEVQGINLNELSDAADRDPITGCPHHKATACRLERI